MGVKKAGFKGSRVLGYKEEHEGRWMTVPLARD
jgi:hypothetical protein